MYISTSHLHYYASLLSRHLPFFLVSWLIPTLPVRHSTILQIAVMDVAYMTAKLEQPKEGLARACLMQDDRQSTQAFEVHFLHCDQTRIIIKKRFYADVILFCFCYC
jgi:hypothetical protein